MLPQQQRLRATRVRFRAILPTMTGRFVWHELMVSDPKAAIAFYSEVIGWKTEAFGPPKDGDQWRINFSRVEWDFDIVDGKYQKVKGRPEHNWVWSPQGVIDMHRPEHWGYLQFSTAKPGTATLKPDESAPIRDALHRVYYAQQAYRKTHKKYARTMAELGLKGDVAIETTTHGFEASVLGKKRWTIREDSRIERE